MQKYAKGGSIFCIMIYMQNMPRYRGLGGEFADGYITLTQLEGHAATSPESRS